MFAEIFLNTSQFLGILCVLGLIGVCFRWKHAVRKDFLVAYGIVLFGIFMREMPVYYYGTSNWPDLAMIMSFVSRWVMIVGALLFVRASSLQVCGERGWIASLLFALLISVVW